MIDLFGDKYKTSHILDPNKDKRFNPSSLVDDVVESDLNPNILANVKNINIEKAGNFHEFITNRNYLNTNLFGRQIQLGLLLFEDFCPYCSDLDYVNDIYSDEDKKNLLTHVQLLQFGKCPRCGKTRADFWDDPAIRNIETYDNLLFSIPYELDVCAGMRSGKSAMCVFIALYQLHRYLMLHPTPSDFYGTDRILPGQELQFTFVAVQKDQVYDNIWKELIELYDASPWFNEYTKYVIDTGNIKGLPLYKRSDHKKDPFIRFRNKHIELKCETPNKKTLRGRTRAFCVTGNTLITTPKGLVPIDSLESENYKVVYTGKNIVRNVTHYHNRNINLLYSVVTEQGFAISGSKEHPVLTVNNTGELDYKNFEDITEGDIAAIQTGFNFCEKVETLPALLYVNDIGEYKLPSKMNTNLAKLLGYFTAAGSTSLKNITVPIADSDLAQDFKDVFKKIFGFIPDTSGATKTQTFTITNRLVVRFLRLIGARSDVREREVPWSILRGTREHVIAFLKAYFDINAVQDRNLVYVSTSSSTELHQQIQILLGGLGIISKRTTTSKPMDTTNYKVYSKLSIYSHYFDLFGTIIGSNTRRKSFQQITTRRGNISKISRLLEVFDFIPEPIKNILSTYKNANIKVIVNILKNSKIPSSNSWASLLNSGFYFDKISSVTSRNYDKRGVMVYDITVDIDHNFGSNLFISHNCSIDEIGWFDHDMEQESAKSKTTLDARDTYEALRKSLRTVRSCARRKREGGYYDVPEGLFVNISSPSAVTDMIMSLVKANNNRHITYLYPTWEFNPSITKEELLEESDNEEAFERDYGAIPPFSDRPYISSSEVIEKAIDPSYNQYHLLKSTIKKYTDNYNTKHVYLSIQPKVRELTIPRLLTIDTGYKNNSYSIVMTHYDKKISKVIIDFCIELSPASPSNKGYSVNFDDMYEFAITPLLTHFNIKNLVFDRWSSLEYVHRLNKEYKVRAEQKSLRWSEFLTIRNRIYEGYVRIPYPEMTISEFKKSGMQLWDILEERPVIHLLIQLLTVREVVKKIIKPKGGTDDIFRALALAINFFEDPDNITKYSNYTGANQFTKIGKRKHTGVVLSNNQGHNNPGSPQRSNKYGFTLNRR